MFSTKPSIIRFIIVCMIVYLSGYILASITGNIVDGYIGYQIFWLLLLSFVFSYGLVSIYNDLKLVFSRLYTYFIQTNIND